MIAHVEVGCNHIVGVELAICNLLIEVGHLLKAHLLNEMAHDILFNINLFVLETAL